MARLIGHTLAASGDTTNIDGPSTDVGANGLGQQNALGQRDFDDAGNEYVYLKGVASLAAGDFVMYGQPGFTAIRMLNDANSGGAGLIALALAAVLANSWGWFLIWGAGAVANVATVSAPTGSAALYRTSTTGRAAVTAVAKDCIFGAFLTGASVSNVGPVFLNYPMNMDQSTL